MRYYFDHNSCTPVDPRVLERFCEIETACPGNPGSLHATGRKSRGIVEEARYQIASTLGVDVDHVFFVSGGTEANNLIVRGCGDLELPVLCAPVEHPSIWKAVEIRGVEPLAVDAHGAAIVEPPNRPIGLIAIVHGQNEVGTLQPIRAAGELAAELAVPCHVDASQTLGRCPLTEVLRAADSITLSTHKAGGLRGMGVFIDTNVDTTPIFHGGAQQRERRPGTESPSLAAATALALTLAIEEQPSRARAMLAAKAAFVSELESDVAVVLTPSDSLPNTVMIRFVGVAGRELLPALDMAGVEASQGSACSSGSPTPPIVLTAMGLDDAARSCVRFSFSQHTTSQEAREGARVVKSVVHGMQSR